MKNKKINKKSGLEEVKNLTKESIATSPMDLNAPEHSLYSKVGKLHRESSGIKKWREALDRSESIISSYYLLIRLFREIELDSEVSSAKGIRIQNVLGRNITFLKNGEEDDKITQYFKDSNWFNKFIEQCMESYFFGYTYFHIGDIENDMISNIESVKREFFNPKTQELLKHYTDVSGENINEGELAEWTFSISPYSLLNDYQGLYAKIAPYQIYYKEAVQSLSDLLQRFGTPTPVVKTSLHDEESLRHLEGYLKNLQNSSYLILSQDDEVEFMEADGTGADSFVKQIEEMKKSISKLILGSSTLGDESSFVGSANIAASNAHLYALSDIDFIERCYLVLRDKLVGLGLTFLEGTEIVIDKQGKTTPEDKNFVLELVKTGKYKIPASYFSDTLGIQIEDVEEAPEETSHIKKEDNE